MKIREKIMFAVMIAFMASIFGFCILTETPIQKAAQEYVIHGDVDVYAYK